jgi:hypothetical protein
MMEDLLESKFIMTLAALAVGLSIWTALYKVPRGCTPLTPPESLWMPRGSTTCDLSVGGLSPAIRK